MKADDSLVQRRRAEARQIAAHRAGLHQRHVATCAQRTMEYEYAVVMSVLALLRIRDEAPPLVQDAMASVWL